MARGAGGVVLAALLLGLVAGAETAAADPAGAPVTIRGTNVPVAPGMAEGSSIVLRGTTPPAPPPVVHYGCPPGYENDPEAGCVVRGYGSEADYEWYWAPYGFGRRRGFRPHHHAVSGFAPRPGFGHGAGFHGMPVAHGFGGGHR
jgi:hypothetical protein